MVQFSIAGRTKIMGGHMSVVLVRAKTADEAKLASKLAIPMAAVRGWSTKAQDSAMSAARRWEEVVAAENDAMIRTMRGN